MLRLNDDCLRELFSYFTLKEQLTLTKVCLLFQRCIIYDIWRLRYRILDTGSEQPQVNALSNGEYQEFFEQIARYIKHFTLADSRHIPFTGYLGHVTKRPELSYYLSYRYDNLQVLYCFDPSIHNGHVMQLTKNCPSLRELHIRSKYVTGMFIEKMYNLNKLNASGCSLNAAHFRVMHRSYITYLDIGNNMLDTSTLSQVVVSNAYEQPLNTLCLDVTQLEESFLRSLHRYPNLLSYRIDEYQVKPLQRMNSRNWYHFLRFQAKRIEIIKFCNPRLRNGPHKTLTSKIINKYLGFFKNLKTIHFERFCTNERFKAPNENVECNSVLSILLSYIASESSSNLNEIRLSNFDISQEAFLNWLTSLSRCERHVASTKKIVLNIFIDKPYYEQAVSLTKTITNSNHYRKQSNYTFQLNSLKTRNQQYCQTSVELHLKKLESS